jgi:hypothetical protein
MTRLTQVAHFCPFAFHWVKDLVLRKFLGCRHNRPEVVLIATRFTAAQSNLSRVNSQEIWRATGFRFRAASERRLCPRFFRWKVSGVCALLPPPLALRYGVTGTRYLD